MKSVRLAVALAVLALAGLMAAAASADVIRVQSTTDINDSGQWEKVMGPAYEKKSKEEGFNDTLKPEFVGTGKALENAEKGLADVVITHAPSLEEKFVAAGYSLEPLGRAVFYNDYVIVGPTSDPAKVAENDPENAIGAFEAIAAAGAAGKASFISRNDASGTNVQEQILWGKSAVSPKRLACNGKSDPTRFEPVESGSPVCPAGAPKWYVQTGEGQAANLKTTNDCLPAKAPNGGCYTMLDRGTWLHNKAKSPNLKIVSQGNAKGSGGASLQTNYFHAYVLNPAHEYPNEEGGAKKPNAVAGQRFVNFLVSEATQEAFSLYPTEAQPAGHPDAVGEAVYASSPPNGPSESLVTITATLQYAAPPKPVLASYPSVQLQKFQGSTWNNVTGAVGTTNSEGKVTFSGVKLNASTTKFRVVLPQTPIMAPGIFTLFTAGTAMGEPLTVPVP